MNVITNYIHVCLLFLLEIIILSLYIIIYISRLFRGSVIGEGGRYYVHVSYYRPHVYYCKYNYIKNLKNSHIIHFHNITLITKFQINIFNIEYVITNNHLGVGNRGLSPICDELLHNVTRSVVTWYPNS